MSAGAVAWRIAAVACGCKCRRYPGFVQWVARALVITVMSTATVAVAVLGVLLCGGLAP